MTSRPESQTESALRWSAAACMAAAAVLFALRAVGAVSFETPLHVLTSGFEQESLFAVWKAATGRVVYTRPEDAPFMFSNFNWLFYAAYGKIAAAVLSVLSLADDWLPTVARVVTLSGCAACFAVALQAFAVARCRATVATAGLAVLVAFGPLVGFWGLTVRPDVWTFAFEAAAFSAFALLDRRSPVLALALLIALGLVAWSMKHIALFAFAGAGLYLLSIADWKRAAVLAAVPALAMGATLAAGGEAFRHSLVGVHAGAAFDGATALRVCGNVALKTVPIWAGLALVALRAAADAPDRRRLWDDGAFRIGLTVTVVSLVLALAGAAKIGAAENYFFFPVFAAAFTLARASAVIEDALARPWAVRVRAAAWGLQALAIAAVVAGFGGVVSLRPVHAETAPRVVCVKAQPKPLFVPDQYLSLPWVMGAEAPAIGSFYYPTQRAAGAELEHGGIGGMIEARLFETVLLAPGLDTYDGGSLAGYAETGDTCGGFAVYRRR